MIPALNMSNIQRGPPVNTTNNPSNNGSNTTLTSTYLMQSSVTRQHASLQMSPRTPNAISPRDANSSQPSAHLTRRAADVAPMLEMNPLQCQNIVELQRKLIETAEWVVKLRYFYTLQLQERDRWLDGRLRDLENYYNDAVAATVNSRIMTAAAAAAANNSDTLNVNSGTTGNGSPATISAAKVGVSSGGVPHCSVNEAKMAENGKGSSTTPPRRHRSKQQQQRLEQNPNISSVFSSPQPSLPNNAQVDAISVDVADSNCSSTGRARGSHPKKSAVVRIPEARRTISAGGARRHATRQDNVGSPWVGGGGSNIALMSPVHRGEAPPTRAARATAEKDSNNNDTSNVSEATAEATRRRAPPALAASREPTPGFVDGSGGPRLDALTVTGPVTMRLGKSPLLDSTPTNYLPLSGSDANRRRSGSSSSRRRCYTSSPRAAMTAATADLSVKVPQHTQYLEAGFGLGRDLNGGSGSAPRERNGFTTSMQLLGEPQQNRTPREGSTFFFVLGSGGGSRPGRLHNTSASSQASQLSASRGLSSLEKRKDANSGDVNA